MHSAATDRLAEAIFRAAKWRHLAPASALLLSAVALATVLPVAVPSVAAQPELDHALTGRSSQTRSEW